MAAALEIDQLLRMAIEQKRLIRLIYRDKPRIVEPHDYGVHKGSIKLLAYQAGGFSSGPLPNWRWMEVNLISGIGLLNRSSQADGQVPRASITNGTNSLSESSRLGNG